MILYLDSSALVPLVVSELSTPVCRRLWDAADDVVTARLMYVEVSAAIPRAERGGRITAAQHDAALEVLESLWSQVQVSELDETLVRRSSTSARLLGLRGYDAVHCAAAEVLGGDELVAAAGDAVLLQAWVSRSIAVAATNAQRQPAAGSAPAHRCWRRLPPCQSSETPTSSSTVCHTRPGDWPATPAPPTRRGSAGPDDHLAPDSAHEQQPCR